MCCVYELLAYSTFAFMLRANYCRVALFAYAVCVYDLFAYCICCVCCMFCIVFVFKLVWLIVCARLSFSLLNLSYWCAVCCC